jgi:hypothetical protein
MREQNITLPWGDDDISLSLPAGWHLNGVREPSPRPGVENPAAEVRRSLEGPSGSPRLRDLVEEGMAVAEEQVPVASEPRTSKRR